MRGISRHRFEAGELRRSVRRPQPAVMAWWAAAVALASIAGAARATPGELAAGRDGVTSGEVSPEAHQVAPLTEQAPGRVQAGAVADGPTTSEMAARSAFIRHYLVLGPLKKASATRSARRLGISIATFDAGGDIAEIVAEKGSRDHNWTVILSDSDIVDLDTLLGPSGRSALVALTVHSAGRQACELRLGSDGPLRAWVNGAAVFSFEGTRRHRLQRDVAPIVLEPGRNTIVLEVRRGERWRFSARLSMPDKFAVPGVSLEPLPAPPQLWPLAPLLAAPGGTLSVPIRGDVQPPTHLRLEGCPSFVSMEQAADGPRLRLSPLGKPRAPFVQCAVVAERGATRARVEAPIFIVPLSTLDFSPSFDAVPGGRYSLFVYYPRPADSLIDLTSHVSWRVVSGAAGKVSSGGLFEAITPGKAVVVWQYGSLSGQIEISVSSDVGIRPYTRRVTSIKTLVSVYRDPECDTCSEQAWLAAIRGREFYYRNTHGMLNLDIDFKDAVGSIPRHRGSYWWGIKRDLRRRGVRQHDYGIIASLGPSTGPCYGAGRLLGAAAMHCSQLEMSYFVHEIQHTLDRVIAERSGLPDMVYGHGYTEPTAFGSRYYPVVAGRGASWEAAVLRDFDAYHRFRPPWNTFVEVVDTDGDGLADADSRLPTDELREGSNPLLYDTDGDGSSDWDEYQAGIYSGSDPNERDTDRDGLIDGLDLYPLYPMAADPVIPFAHRSPKIDGALEPYWALLVRGINAAGQCLDLKSGCRAVSAPRFYGLWNESGLFLAVESEERVDSLLVNIDGSGTDGPWLGGDFYVVFTTPGRRGRLMRAEGRFANSRDGARPVLGGEVMHRRRGGRHVIEVKIPVALGDGFGWEHLFLNRPVSDSLLLSEGQVVGLSFKLRTAKYTVTPFENQVFVKFRLGEVTKTIPAEATRGGGKGRR